MRGKFTLEIKLGNAEMSEPEHLAEAVKSVSEKLEYGQTSGKVLDANGNIVGSYKIA